MNLQILGRRVLKMRRKMKPNNHKFNNGFKPMILNLEDKSYGVCPAPMSATVALDILSSYLLGDDFCINMTVSPDQATSVVVQNILFKYSKKWKKDHKKYNEVKALFDILNTGLKGK